MRNIFRYLKSYSTQPFEVDRLIVSAFLEINQLQILENQYLLEYSINENQIDEHTNLIDFIKIINTEIAAFDIEKLIELFEFVISPSDRIINGAIYTPNDIRDYIDGSYPNLEYENRPIQIRDLLTHSSGIRRDFAQPLTKMFSLDLTKEDRDKILNYDRETLLKDLKQFKLDTIPYHA